MSFNRLCQNCGYPNGFGCEYCCSYEAVKDSKSKAINEITSEVSKKRGPKPRPEQHQSKPIRVPLCLHEGVKEMVKEWKKEKGYV